MSDAKVTHHVRDFALVESDRTIAIHRMRDGEPEKNPITIGLTQLSFTKRHQLPGLIEDTTLTMEERQLVHLFVNALAGI